MIIKQGYAVSGSALTVKDDYLKTLNLAKGDTAKFKISFDAGNSVTFTVNAVNNYTPSSNASLKSVTVNGDKVSGFDADKVEYNVELPYGTASVTVGAAAEDTHAAVAIT